MKELMMATTALDYIENHLTDDLKTEDIANYLYVSKSSVEKLFRYVTNMSIKDYCIRRRMTCAAKELRNNTSQSLLDIAVKYGYGSNEAFTRAFKSVWHTTPSEYCKNPLEFELFPAFKLEKEIMEDEAMKNKKKVDISELYDVLRQRKNCYVVAVDIKGILDINEVAHEAGDIAILTALKRLENASGEEDVVFRIGADEFVSLTNSEEEAYADKVKAEVASHNGETFTYKDKEIPLNLYVTSFKFDYKILCYSDVFKEMQGQLDNCKNIQ